MTEYRLYMQHGILLLLLVIVGLSKPSAYTDPYFNVKDYGAKGNGKDKDSKAIAQALEACTKAGGGTVYFPAGTYLTAPIHITYDNITLFIGAGATILGSPDFEDYPTVETRWEGVNSAGYSPLIYAKEVKNVTIKGRGVIDGNGKPWWDHHFELQRQYQTQGNRLQDLSVVQPDGVRGKEFWEKNKTAQRDPADKFGWMWRTQFLRPCLVEFYGCQNVWVEGITLQNSPFWTLHPVYCDNVNIIGITITNPMEEVESPNTDGINPDSSTNVKILNCTISVGDDCIVIKSGRDEDGRQVGRPSENITIMNCTMLNGRGAVAIGSEMSGGVRNVVVSNCVIKNTHRGLQIKTMRGRGGTVENIAYNNLIMENVRGPGIIIDARYHPTPTEPVSERTPQVKDIYIANVVMKNVGAILRINGLKEMPIRGVRIFNLTANANKGVSITYAQDIHLHEHDLKVKEGKLFDIENAQAVEIADKKIAK